MKKFLAAALIPFALAACQNPYAIPAGDENKFRVGAILPLSGDAASLGKASQNGIEMALADLDPAVRDQIAVYFEDDQLQPKQTVTALQKLRSIEKIDTLLTLSSGTSNAIAPIAERAKLPMVAIASSKNIVDGKNWVVKHWVRPSQEVAATIPEIKKRYKKIAMIWALHEGYLAMKKEFYDQLGDDAKNLVVLDEEWQPTGVQDFKIFGLRAREAGADAISIGLLPGQIALFTKQAREMGFTGEFFGWEFLEDPNEVKMANGRLDGAWYANAADPESDFIARYREKFPGETFIGAANAYDSIMILARAVEKFTPGMTTEEKRAAVNREFHELKDFCGAAGCYSASGENDFTLPAMLKVVSGTGFEALYPDGEK